MQVEPFVEAGPAEEMAAESYDWILGQFEADVAFEISCVRVACARAGWALGVPAGGFPVATRHTELSLGLFEFLRKKK